MQRVQLGGRVRLIMRVTAPAVVLLVSGSVAALTACQSTQRDSRVAVTVESTSISQSASLRAVGQEILVATQESETGLYRPPSFVLYGSPWPPQTIISVPVQIVLCSCLIVGHPVSVDVGVH